MEDADKLDEMKPSNTMASTFGNRTISQSVEELRKARETRAAEALRMKDDNIKMLSEQNTSLLESLEKVRFYLFCCFISLTNISFISWKKKPTLYKWKK
jgi:hypothetical protein